MRMSTPSSVGPRGLRSSFSFELLLRFAGRRRCGGARRGVRVPTPGRRRSNPSTALKPGPKTKPRTEYALPAGEGVPRRTLRCIV